MSMAGFFAVHSGLSREGPGTAGDVTWACAAAAVAPGAAICDAACGPGADIAALRRAAPDGTVVAFDRPSALRRRGRAPHIDATDACASRRARSSGRTPCPIRSIWVRST